MASATAQRFRRRARRCACSFGMPGSFFCFWRADTPAGVAAAPPTLAAGGGSFSVPGPLHGEDG
ncbi:hypothetical protein [Thermogemmatispora sp.]|uniref:hypothetical protein n=1 Tax=Thermogemmatispora sp. TaxID=1968838 RepID=UPI001D7073F6|nr:hypothetical protein [Thermogemmatispora sp.]MBX5449800.1 hypothetical protein [Thermogemmatispora sp.]